MTELRDYTLSSGKTIQLRRVSIFTLQAAMNAVPEPRPPVQIIDGKEEENYQHPDYQKGRLAYEKARALAAEEATFACGIKAPFGDEEKAELAEFRENAKLLGIPVADNDWSCYVTHCLLGSAQDINDVRAIILEGSLPSEEGIGKQAESFKSAVSSPADLEGVGAAFGDNGRQS